MGTRAAEKKTGPALDPDHIDRTRQATDRTRDSIVPFDMFATFPLLINLGFFALVATAVWHAGTRLAAYADEISDRRRIGKAIMGLIFLATATSLPEIVTATTAALAGNAQLLLANIFGSITMQTAILAVADAVAIGASITFYPRKPTPILEGILLVLLLAILQAIILYGERTLVFHVGFGACLIAIAYLVIIAMLRQFDEKDTWLAIEFPKESGDPPVNPWPERMAKVDMSGLLARFAAASLVILICGILLVALSEEIAVQSGLGQGFIGVTILAASTSLPELSTTIMAVRLRSYTMAISNIFGSNLIMIILLLPADILYTDGLLLAQADPIATFAILTGIIVTIIYVIGLVIRSSRTVFGIGIDSLLVLSIYVASLGIAFQLR
ncbi:MAG: sodium:calcium antiporter [Alphaproteobacteria bacterium]